MKKIIVIYVFFVFYFAEAQIADVGKNNLPKLYLSLGEYGPLMQKNIKNNNIITCQFVSDGQFLGKEPYTFDPILLTQEINRGVPNPNDSGIVYIDLESPYLDNLMNKEVDDESFQKSLKLYIDVIQFAKKLRPNAKWGYYYLPFTTYWSRTSSFFDKHKKIESLISECDILFPSLYIFYEEKDKSFALENKKYVIENTKELIKISQIYKKPIMVFVWHRYHNSNSKVGLKFLPEKVFLTHIKRIINTTFEGRKVDGVVWWGGDDYSFRQNHKAITDEFKGNESGYKLYNDKVLTRLFKKIKKIVNLK